jgi:hypothetical protein
VTFAPDQDALRDELRAAVEEIVRKHGGMVTKWVIVGEVAELGEDGPDTGCWLMASPGIRSWETMGLLGFALSVEDASVARAEREEDP